MVKTAKDYYSSHLIPYEQPEQISYLNIPVLEFLKGRKWDEIALAYCHAMNPTSIRVTSGLIKLDSRIGRITVYVDDENKIEGIEQEVEIGLPEGVEDGYELSQLL